MWLLKPNLLLALCGNPQVSIETLVGLRRTSRTGLLETLALLDSSVGGIQRSGAWTSSSSSRLFCVTCGAPCSKSIVSRQRHLSIKQREGAFWLGALLWLHRSHACDSHPALAVESRSWKWTESGSGLLDWAEATWFPKGLFRHRSRHGWASDVGPLVAACSPCSWATLAMHPPPHFHLTLTPGGSFWWGAGPWLVFACFGSSASGIFEHVVLFLQLELSLLPHPLLPSLPSRAFSLPAWG